MKNNIFIALTVLLKLVAFFLIPGMALAAELNVPADYDSIQAAINAASAGDTVTVAPGTYTENLVLTSDIILQGGQTARTLLKPPGITPVVSITGQANITLRRFTFSAAATGIAITNSATVTIASNVFATGLSNTGILVTDNSGVMISNNTFWNNAIGISRVSFFTEIQNNIFMANSAAIAAAFSETNITYNCYYQNEDGITAGTEITTGDPRLVDTADNDFHLKEGSACIDVGTGTDVIDGSVADAGAYGGQHADSTVLPVPLPVATDTSGSVTGPYSIRLEWSANPSYLVTSSANPGGYLLYYDSDSAGPPYEGTDAGGGIEPSPIDVGSVTTYRLENLSPSTRIPASPVLQPLQPSNQAIDVSWSAVSGATSYTVYYGIDSTAANQVSVGNRTSYKLDGLQNGTSYRVAVSATSQPVYYLAVRAYDSTAEKNTSDYSAEASIVLGPANESSLSSEMTAIPERVMPYPDLPNEGCFIATAAWGYYSAPEVQALRDFRDNYLLPYPAGQAFVAWYYANSPRLAREISRSPTKKTVVRLALLPLVGIAVFLQEATVYEKYTVVLLLSGLMFLIARRRRMRRKLENRMAVDGARA